MKRKLIKFLPFLAIFAVVVILAALFRAINWHKFKTKNGEQVQNIFALFLDELRVLFVFKGTTADVSIDE